MPVSSRTVGPVDKLHQSNAHNAPPGCQQAPVEKATVVNSCIPAQLECNHHLLNLLLQTPTNQKKKKKKYPDIPKNCPVPLTNQLSHREWYWALESSPVLSDLDPGPVRSFSCYAKRSNGENALSRETIGGDLSPDEIRWEMYKGLYQNTTAAVAAQISAHQANYVAETQQVIQTCKNHITTEFTNRGPKPAANQINPSPAFPNFTQTQTIAPSQGILCSSCKNVYPRDHFSTSQMNKTPSARRCQTCVVVPGSQANNFGIQID